MSNASPMRRLSVTLTALAVLTGCAAPLERDLFSGTYRFADSREKGYLVVSPIGANKWIVHMSVSGEPLATHPLSEGGPVVVARQEVLTSAFVSPTPISQVSCLASSGRFSTPLVCRMPVNTEYQLAEAMNPKSRLRAATGYIVIVPTAAGVLAAELIRRP
jgi:hypothetical protein